MAQNTLKTLPAELKNNIYDLVFAADDKGEPVDLRDIRPPSRSLLLVCRQFYNEANQMYRAHFKTYWRSSQFVLDFRLNEIGATTHDKEVIALLDSDAVQQITNLRIRTSWDEITLDAATGIWSFERLASEGCRQVVVRKQDKILSWCLCFDKEPVEMLSYERPSLKEQVQYHIERNCVA